MKRILIEVAIETVADACAADSGGADRLELCAALDLGGLTPSLGSLLEVRARSSLPTVVMIRTRPGDFVTDDDEVRVMARDIELFVPYRPAGFVFGCLQPDGRVSIDHCRRLIEASAGLPCIFHRAFDRCPNPPAALDTLRDLGFKRLLTSGREETALQGVMAISETVAHADGRIEVLPCGRVRAENAAEIVQLTGCDQVHGSFAVPRPPKEGRGYRGYPVPSRTSEEAVAATRASLTQLVIGN